MRRLKILFQHKYLIKIIAIIFLTYSLIVTNFFSFKSKYNINDSCFYGKIIKIKLGEEKINLYIKGKEVLIVNYYYKNNNERKKYNNLLLGDYIKVKGILTLPSNNTVPNTFNYKRYLETNRIYYLIKAKSIEKIKNNTSVFYYIKNIINKRINKISKSKNYLNTLLIGNKTIEEDVLSTYQSNGISHLFSISGMHISLFLGIIFFILDRVSYNNYYKYSIAMIILIFYMFLVNTISIKRSIIMFLLFSINKLLKLKIKSIDIMCLTLIILIIINPFTIYMISFQYSYLITLFLILFSNKIKLRKNYFSKLLYISYLSFLVSLPITIYNFYEINLISIVLNLFYVPIVSFIIFPLSILTFVLPFMDNILFIFIKIIEFISILVNKINITKIIISKPSIVLLTIYYILIILILNNKKYLVLLIMVIIINKVSIYINNDLKITYLDIGQGDSIFVSLPHNSSNILIDTGGNINSSISKNKIIPYLKSEGIPKIDYLIITHGDYDHMGEGIYLVNNFKVEKVIFNVGEYNDLEEKLIEILDKKNIKYHSNLRVLNINNSNLYFLNTGIYDNENDNSNVIYLKYYNYKFLFMGDAGVDREKDILNKYNLSNIDFLKIGHHGSNTSTSKVFIDIIKPKKCVISVGKNNRYGHPKKTVLDTLSNYCNIYRTDINGSIKIKINKNNYKIKTYSP